MRYNGPRAYPDFSLLYANNNNGGGTLETLLYNIRNEVYTTKINNTPGTLRRINNDKTSNYTEKFFRGKSLLQK